LVRLGGSQEIKAKGGGKGGWIIMLLVLVETRLNSGEELFLVEVLEQDCLFGLDEMAVAEAYHARARMNFGTGQRLARRIERDPLLVALAREQIRLFPSALKDSDDRLVMTYQFHSILLLLAHV
jgi:hypothetical protein